MNLNSYRWRAGWCRVSSLVSAASVLLASSLAVAQDAKSVLNNLSTQASTQATSYGSAVVLLLGALAALILFGFLAYALFQLIERRSSE